MTKENQSEEHLFDGVKNNSNNDVVINDVVINDEVEKSSEMKPSQDDRLTKTTKKPNSKKTLIVSIVGASVVLVAALIGFAVYLTQTPNNAQREALRQQQLAAMQMQQQADQNQNVQSQNEDAQNLNQNAEKDEQQEEKNEQNNEQNEQKEQNQEQNLTNGSVGSEISGSFVFDSDGNIASANEKQDSQKESLSTEQILANKDINVYTEDELKSAWTIVDVELTNITATQNALSNRMRELGIDPPYSQAEARQAIHDKALIEEITTKLSDKITQNMIALNKKMDDLNQSQIILARDMANTLADVMRRISIEDIGVQKQKRNIDELTQANASLLGKYQIKQMASGRVWIQSENSQKPVSYTVNDNIGDNIIIESIDLNEYKIVTNKGEIKYNFK